MADIVAPDIVATSLLAKSLGNFEDDLASMNNGILLEQLAEELNANNPSPAGAASDVRLKLLSLTPAQLRGTLIAIAQSDRESPGMETGFERLWEACTYGLGGTHSGDFETEAVIALLREILTLKAQSEEEI